MDSEERKRREELLATMDDRRSSADKFAWAVPAIIVASQAFLIPFALDPETSAGRRAWACGAALVLTAAAGHFFWKQMFAIQLFEAIGKRERDELNLFRSIGTPCSLMRSHSTRSY